MFVLRVVCWQEWESDIDDLLAQVASTCPLHSYVFTTQNIWLTAPRQGNEIIKRHAFTFRRQETFCNVLISQKQRKNAVTPKLDRSLPIELHISSLFFAAGL